MRERHERQIGRRKFLRSRRRARTHTLPVRCGRFGGADSTGGCNHSSVQRILAESGGIRPAQRHRSQLALTLAEREEISRALAAGGSIQSIAMRLSRAPSTICREIKRNSGAEGYRASHADGLAWDRARRPKACKLVQHRTLAQIVAASCSCNGHRSRLPDGSGARTQTTRTITCPARLSTAVSSYRPVVS